MMGLTAICTAGIMHSKVMQVKRPGPHADDDVLRAEKRGRTRDGLNRFSSWRIHSSFSRRLVSTSWRIRASAAKLARASASAAAQPQPARLHRDATLPVPSLQHEGRRRRAIQAQLQP
jgi:hypothetical protein